MKELFMLIRDRLLLNEPMVLAIVIKSSGSTPRGAGARMLVGKGTHGEAIRLWGTIGGGLPEHLAIEEAGSLVSEHAANPAFSFRKYALHPNGAAELGVRCGGEVSVFFRSMDLREPGLLDLVEKAVACFSNEKAVWFVMGVIDELPGGEAGQSACRNSGAQFSLGIADAGGFLAYTGKGCDDEQYKNACGLIGTKTLLGSTPVLLEEKGSFWFSEPLVHPGFVYIFGGGHIAQELVPLLAHLGFRCIVFDDREEFSKPYLFSGVEKVILGDFNRIGNSLSLTENDYVVIVTRGHLWDLEAFAFALESKAAYIGVIGSRAKYRFVEERLLERGFSPDTINASRVHAPIGIDIKSETPAEIAVSIAGELILTRAH